jgi:hypothetical protein
MIALIDRQRSIAGDPVRVLQFTGAVDVIRGSVLILAG